MLALTSTRALLVAAALALPMTLSVGAGCNGQRLTKLQFPEAGLTLHYDLSPGQVYEGHVHMRSAFNPIGELSSTVIVDFDVAIKVLDQGDGTKRPVEATVTNIEVDARVYGGMSTDEAVKALDGTQIRFDLDQWGDVSNEPYPPLGLDANTERLFGLVANAVTEGISVRLPDETIQDRATWDIEPEQPRAPSVKSQGTLRGLWRNSAGEELAKLKFERTRAGSTTSITTKTKALFFAHEGYPVWVARKINRRLGRARIYVEIEARWSKMGHATVPTNID